MSERVNRRLRGLGGRRCRGNRRVVAVVVIATMVTVLSAVSGASASAPDKIISDFGAADVLDFAPDDVYLAGADTTDPGPLWELRHWDGHGWSAVAGDTQCCHLVDLSALSDHDIWALGYGNSGNFVVHGQLGAWESTALPDSAWDYPQSIVALSDSDVWAFGYLAGGGPRDYEKPVTWHFDGTSWSKVAPPITGDGIFGDATASGPHSMWVTGVQTGGGFIAHWNGHSWTLRANMIPAAFGVGAVGRRDVWAVGGGGADGPFTSHWDGTGWTDGLGASAVGAVELQDVAGSSPTNVWAVGYETRSVQTARLLTEHWDGQTWTKVRAAHPTEAVVEELSGVSTSGPDDAWAIGWTRTPEGGVVERWDGTRWHSVDPTP